MFSPREAVLAVATAALALLLVSPTSSLASPAQDDIKVDVSRHGDNVSVHAQLTVPVTAHQAYSVLNDYDHMQQFLPGLEKSHILERTGNRLLVAQAGGVQLGPFSIPYDYVRLVELKPDAQIVSHVVSGSIKKADVTTTLNEANGQTTITYDSDATISIWLPFGISTTVMASHIRKQLDSMRAEMLRRKLSGSVGAPVP